MTTSAVVKIAGEIDESKTDVGGYGMVSLIVSSHDGTQGTEERVLAFMKDTTSHAPPPCWVAFGVRIVVVKDTLSAMVKLAREIVESASEFAAYGMVSTR